MTTKIDNHAFYLSRWAVLCLVAVISAFFLLFYFYPYANDDFWFLSDIKRCASAAGKTDNLWSGLWDTCLWRYRTDNARLANTAFIFMLLVPRIIPSLISTISLGITYLLMLRLANVSKLSTFAIVSFFLCIFFPWNDSLFLIMYQMNYIWVCPWMLLSIHLFLNGNGTKPWIALAVGLVTGLSHEGFALPVIFSAVLMLLFRKVPVNKERLLLIIGLSAGTAWLLLAPSLHARTTMFNESLFKYSIGQRIRIMTVCIPLIIYMVLWTVCYIKKGWRKIALSNINLMCLSIGIATIPFYQYCFSTRSVAPLVIVSGIGVAWTVEAITHGKRQKLISMAASLLSLAFIATHLYATCRQVIVLHNNTNAIYKEYVSHKDKRVTIYAKETLNYQIPWIVLERANFINNYNKFTYKHLAALAGTPLHQILPIQLKDYHGQQDIVLPGNAGARLYGGLVIISCDQLPKTLDIENIQVTIGGNPHECDIFRFTGSDGKEYVLVDPVSSKLDLNRTPLAANCPELSENDHES